MNIDNGRILLIDEPISEIAALTRRLVPIDLTHATEKQKAEMRVSLRDHSSALGKQLKQWRSKYVPHKGAKELARAIAGRDGTP